MVRGTKEMLKGIKPLHGVHHSKRFMFPYLDNWTEMTLFSKEIEAGLKCGYEYQVIDGYMFDQGLVTADFFKDLFIKKAQAKARGEDSLSSLYKILVNSGYGVWGYNPLNKDSLNMYNKKSTGWVLELMDNRMKSFNRMGEYIFTNSINKTQSTDTNVAIASAITSYARIMMHKLLCDVESVGGKLYYCDTDSVICNIKISDHPSLVQKYRKVSEVTLRALRRKNDFTDEDVDHTRKLMAQGEWLGGLKNEFMLDAEGNDVLFDKVTIMGCKMYSIQHDDKPESVKLKGYKKRKLDGSEYSKDELYDVMESIYGGEEVSQEQFQIMINKHDYLTQHNALNIRYNETKKRFKSVYTKGIKLEDGTIEPMAI
jgi:DNA polymerase elongation subunit (family B)